VIGLSPPGVQNFKIKGTLDKIHGGAIHFVDASQK
jgi:hypothetical protein